MRAFAVCLVPMSNVENALDSLLQGACDRHDSC